MTTLFFCVLSVLLCELAFLAGYLLTYIVYVLAEFPLVALTDKIIPRGAHASLAGILCGTCGAFCALSSAQIFSVFIGLPGSWLLILSMALPFIGLVSYLGNRFRQVATGYSYVSPLYERLHAAVMAIPIRMQFETMKSLLERAHAEQVGAEGDPLGHMAYSKAVMYSLNMTITSLLGLGIGVLLAYEVVVSR